MKDAFRGGKRQKGKLVAFSRFVKRERAKKREEKGDAGCL